MFPHLRRAPARRPRLLSLVTRMFCLAAALASVLLFVTPAQAATTLFDRMTYNLPSVTEAGSADYVAYADTSAAGSVHVVLLDSSYGVAASWYYPGSTTFVGSGPSISSKAGEGVVVAWADGSSGDIYLAYLNGSGFTCVTDMANSLAYATGNSYPGRTYDTPYLSNSGADGAGDLYLTWVDAATSHIHISSVNAPHTADCSGTGGFSSNYDTITDAGDAAWAGPSMVVTGSGSGQRFWVMFPGADAGHHLNIATFPPMQGRPLSPAPLTKTTEATHASATDLGGAFNAHTGQIALSYCGTNALAYWQTFAPSGSGGGTEQSTGESCQVSTATVGGSTYWSGGVGAAYEYTTGRTMLSWGDGTTGLIELEGH